MTKIHKLELFSDPAEQIMEFVAQGWKKESHPDFFKCLIEESYVRGENPLVLDRKSLSDTARGQLRWHYLTWKESAKNNRAYRMEKGEGERGRRLWFLL